VLSLDGVRLATVQEFNHFLSNKKGVSLKEYAFFLLLLSI
jgi:hypothetical protein